MTRRDPRFIRRTALATFGDAVAVGQQDIVEQALAAAMTGLGMDAVFVSQLGEEGQVLRHARTVDADSPFRVGAVSDLESSYCQRVIDGRMGQVIPDTAAEPEVADLAATHEARIGAYIGIPLILSDGSTYGALCCVSHEADPDLGEQEARFMRLLAGVVAEAIDRERTMREAASRRDEQLALIAHELRTPLATIIGFAELLGEEPLTEDGVKFLAVVDRSARRLMRLAGDLVLMARLEEGRLPDDAAPVELREILERQVAEHAIAARAHELDLRLAPGGEAVVHGHRDWLVRLVCSLLDNALEFTPAGGTVVVRLRPVGDDAVLDVTDTGPGIPSDQLERVFGRFVRGVAATRDGDPGAGMGLWIVRQVARLHGGDVTAANVPEGGATFTVRLPLAAVGRVAA